MKLLGIGVFAVVGSVGLVGCGGGGGGGGGGSVPPVVTFMPDGVNTSLRPPTFTQRFSTDAGNAYSGRSDLMAESVQYAFGATGQPAAGITTATTRGDGTPSQGAVSFTLQPANGDPYNRFNATVSVSGAGAVSFSNQFVFIPGAPAGNQYLRVAAGAPVDGAGLTDPVTQVSRIGLALQTTGQSLVLADWNASAVNLTYNSYGRWAENVPTPSSGQADRVGVLSFGLPTRDALPSTGTATYSGGFYGVYFVGPSNVGNNGKFEVDGTMTAGVNFAANSVSFATTSSRIFVTGQAGVPSSGYSAFAPGLDVSGTLTIERSNNTFVGAVSATGGSPQHTAPAGGLSGAAQGRFYGPTGASGPPELGGTFQVQGGSGAAREVLIGGFGAKQ